MKAATSQPAHTAWIWEGKIAVRRTRVIASIDRLVSLTPCKRPAFSFRVR